MKPRILDKTEFKEAEKEVIKLGKTHADELRELKYFVKRLTSYQALNEEEMDKCSYLTSSLFPKMPRLQMSKLNGLPENEVVEVIVKYYSQLLTAIELFFPNL